MLDADRGGKGNVSVHGIKSREAGGSGAFAKKGCAGISSLRVAGSWRVDESRSDDGKGRKNKGEGRKTKRVPEAAVGGKIVSSARGGGEDPPEFSCKRSISLG